MSYANRPADSSDAGALGTGTRAALLPPPLGPTFTLVPSPSSHFRLVLCNSGNTSSAFPHIHDACDLLNFF